MRKLETTIHYEQVRDNLNKRILLFQGSSRSGKTVNINLALLILAIEENLVIDITRKTLPALKATVLRDLLFWIDYMGLWSVIEWNKSDRIFKIRGSEICYYSLDEETKVRGRKRDIIFVNELTEVPYDIIKHLLIRTTGTFIGDYNPSIFPSHYINQLAARSDAIKFKSTYKDNLYLEKAIVNEIELLRETDPWMWTVFGLGEMAIPKNIILSFEPVDALPLDVDGEIDAEFLGYGMDVGFQDPTVLVALYKRREFLYVRQIFHQRHLTDPDVVDLFDERGVSKTEYVVTDIDPALQKLLRDAGYKIKVVRKGKGSLVQGIRHLKTMKLRVVKTGFDVINDLTLYKWKEDANGQPTDEPVHKFSHSADAINYGFRTLSKAIKYAVR